MFIHKQEIKCNNEGGRDKICLRLAEININSYKGKILNSVYDRERWKIKEMSHFPMSSFRKYIRSGRKGEDWKGKPFL